MIYESDSVALYSIGVAIDPKTSRTTNVRNTRNNGPVIPLFQMPNIKNIATNAITTLVVFWEIRTISLFGLAINNTKEWLAATAKTATLAQIFRNEMVPSIESDTQMSNKNIIRAMEVDAVARRVK